MSKKLIIYCLGIFIFLLLSITNPSKSDFDQYISSYIRDYVMQISEDNDTANLASGISFPVVIISDVTGLCIEFQTLCAT